MVGSILRVTAFERADIDSDEVRIVIERGAGPEPQVSQRGAILALDFPRPREDPRELSLQLRDAELSELVRAVSEKTGTPFLYDESLQGRVTVAVAGRVSRQEAVELLHSALLLKGYGAVPTPGGPLRVVPIADFPAAAELRRGAPSDRSEAPLVTLVRLEAADPVRLASQLEPWTGRATRVQAYEPTRSLILAGSEQRLHALMVMLQGLDAAAEEEIFTRRLRHRGAESVAEILSEIYAEPRPGAPETLVIPDPRANLLLIRAPRALLPELRDRIAELDQPPPGSGEIDVVRIRYADPEGLAAILAELSAGGAAEPGAPGVAARAQALRGRPLAVAVDAPTSSLVLQGSRETLERVRELLRELDREPARIHVEALVFEVVTSESLQVSVDAFLPVAVPTNGSSDLATLFSNPSGGGLLQPSPDTIPAFAGRYTRSPLMVPITDPSGNPMSLLVPRESVVLTANEQLVESHVLVNPHLLVLSGEEHEIFSGDNLPIPSSRADQTNPFQTQVNVQRQDVGVTLRLTPTVGERGRVRLDFSVETTALRPSLAGDVEEVGPTIAQRRVESSVLLRDGEWVVVGLGSQPERRQLETGIPFLKEIPWLGALVRRTEDLRLDSQFLVAVQARVARGREAQLADSIRRRLGFERTLARSGGQLSAEQGPVGLRIGTLASQADAEALAASFAVGSHAPVVLPWFFSGRERYDVVLTGFQSLSEAAAASHPLALQGFTPQIVVAAGRLSDSLDRRVEASARVPPTAPP